jgi:hypothetical protein
MSMAELRVALDIGSDRHRVGIGTADGKIVEEFEITHNREGFELFFSRITVHEKHLNLPVVVASIRAPRRCGRRTIRHPTGQGDQLR